MSKQVSEHRTGDKVNSFKLACVSLPRSPLLTLLFALSLKFKKTKYYNKIIFILHLANQINN